MTARLTGWLADSAEAIDIGAMPADMILPQLAAAGLTGAGVPTGQGGRGGDVTDALKAIADVARQSLAVAFVLWGHRSYTEFLLQSPNALLRETLLPDLLAGRLAGATGLSNAMKFLAGLEALQITARPEGDRFVIDGTLPWVTNLRPQGFHVAAAADRTDGGPTMIVSLAGDDAGVTRSADLELMAMRSSHTAALTIAGARIGPDRVIAADARTWLPRVRPAFAGMQCGMSIGLAARALDEAEAACQGAALRVLGPQIAEARARLEDAEGQLTLGLSDGRFVTAPAALFRIRIALATLVHEAVALELQASGGRAYLAGPGRDFARRWREAAFIPVITPSLVQLRAALQQAEGQ